MAMRQPLSFDGVHNFLDTLFGADSDEAARVYRAYSAHRSNLMTPTILI
jgi:hypothetical protein